MPIAALFNTLIFTALAGMHFTWALRGGSNLSLTVPTQGGTPVFRPTRTATLVVALGLLAMAFVSLSALTGWLSPSWIRWGNAAIALIFLLRTVGDFRYVGVFKRFRDTAFARNDTRYYSPLCLLLALSAAVIAAQTGA